MLLGGLALLTAFAARADREAAVPEEQTWRGADRVDVQLDVIEAMIEQGAIPAALQGITALRAEGMENDRLDMLQAQALLAAGQPSDALSILERSRAKSVERFRLLGLTHLDMGAPDLAAQAFQRAIRVAKRDTESRELASLYNNLGFALSATGDFDGATLVYREALRLDPASARARNNLGFALAAKGEDDEALAAFRLGQPAGIPPEDREANALYNLGLAQQGRGEVHAAILSYSKAVETRPGHREAQLALSSLAASAPSPLSPTLPPSFSPEPPPEAP
ncbi:tetratricopeptide repeat protein [Myxococcota bacterium]|nr:tetratricopeptide repeat protein [Myxococcota bacterium]